MSDTAALDVFGCPLAGQRLIEASAGTGKTWAICGLYLRLLLEQRFSVQQILVVTFTKAATAELRDRVRQRLVQVLAALRAPSGEADSVDPFVAGLLARLRRRPGHDEAELAPALEQALQTFDEASIFTIHGFCQRALADTPFAARLPLVQELLADDSELRNEAVHDFWRRRVAAADADPALVAHLLERGDSPERYARLLERQLARPLSRLRWPQYIDDATDFAAAAAAVAGHFTAARALWQRDAPVIVDTVMAALKRLNGNTYRKDAVAAAADGWSTLLAATQPPRAGTGLPAKIELLGTRQLAARANKGQQPPSHAFFDAAQALLDALQAEARQFGLARLRLLRELLTEGARQLRETKRQRRVVAFDDMLFNLHQRLAEPTGPALAAALRARFPAALIDEFQDTDPLQFAVFQAIYPEADAPLCLVGDPKQAIYSFRHADLHTYLRARRGVAAASTLLENQRSTRPLIDALNRLFGQNPRAFVQPGLDYHAVAKGQRPLPPLLDRSAQRAALQVWTLPADPRSGQPLPKPDATGLAAAVCAGEIARLLTEAAAGAITLGERPLRAADIAVLVRTHAQGSAMRQALAALGVGSVELSQASVFGGSDAEELERLLAAVLEPARGALLKAALATRWHGLDAAQIDALADDEPGLSALLQRFSAYQALWRSRGVGFMLRQWQQQEQVAQRLLAAADGERRLTNLLHLAECLHQAAAEHPAPEALLRWLQARREGGAAGDEATQLRLESDRNLVQIVTIHKSKGLEYPVVFCPFLWDGRLRPAGDGIEGAARHDDDGEAVIDFRAGLDDGFDEAAAKAEARLEAAAETMRLIYVALTRAMHRCYLVAGSYRSRAGRYWSTAESRRSALNWLVAGGGSAPEAWFAAKSQAAAPATVDAAWAALADGDGAAPAFAVAPLPPAWRQPLPVQHDGAAAPQALPPPQDLGAAWWIGSYSAMLRTADGPAADTVPAAAPPPLRPSDEREAGGRAAADHDLLASAETAAVEPGPGGAALAADDILGFPRGAVAGECVHALFEEADFGDRSHWPMAVARALQRHPPTTDAAAAARAPGQLQRLLADVLDTPLPLGGSRPLRLAELPAQRRLAELEFHLPVPRLASADLAALLAKLGYAGAAPDFGLLQGYLKGFIDLVFEHDGRFFVADWKSNHLGDAAADYGEEPIAAAMAEHHYHLQYLLYTVALHRWLGRRLAAYDYERHVGGVLYLFVRGLRPPWRDAGGRPTGLFFHRPAAAAIESLSALLAGDEGPQ
ncbi:MAG: exodeoxyribonuclease V subunit beta [Burkholderiaceae bacterium]|nr:exodeoxyribonuclease V subunit beta [Burkholderiaceae bacterium]